MDSGPASNTRPFFLLAPGAGAPSTSRWMVAWRERLATLGEVVAFDYPYMRAGKKMPDRLPVLIAAHREALIAATAGLDAGRSIFFIGKSMGSRVGCHLAVELAGASSASPAGVICFGYPLQSGTSGALRDEVLLALRTPILFVQGTRDSLCPLDKLAAVRARMTAPNRLYVVEAGDHSLEVRKAAQAEADDAVLAQIAAFVAAPGER